MSGADLVVWGIVAHLIADWFFQNDWMAREKVKFGHPAGVVHAGIHLVALALVFGWWVALILAAVHYVIDLRFALAWWGRVFRQTGVGPYAPHVQIWRDQVAHIACIAVAAGLVS